MRMRLPYTIYFVAMVRLHRREDRHMLCNEAFSVSGLSPLTRDEAIARFRSANQPKWKEEHGPATDWQESTTTVTWVEIE